MATPSTAAVKAPPPHAAPTGTASPDQPPAAASPGTEFRPLANGRLKLLHSSEAEYGNVWGAVLPAGTPLSHAELPEYWSNHAHRIRAYDEIWINWDDGRGRAKGHVRQVSGAGTNVSRAVVAITESREFDPIPRPPGAVATHVIEYRGPHLKHAIIRLTDGQVVAEGFETPQAAGQALQAIIRRDPKA